jgi:hypothetical protein
VIEIIKTMTTMIGEVKKGLTHYFTTFLYLKRLFFYSCDRYDRRRSCSSNISDSDSSDCYSSVSFNSKTRNRSKSPQRVNSKKHKREEKYRSRYEVLPITYWSRTEECLDAKHKHIEKIDHLCDSRERLVLYTTLYNRRVALEKNMFPCKISPPFYFIYNIL